MDPAGQATGGAGRALYTGESVPVERKPSALLPSTRVESQSYHNEAYKKSLLARRAKMFTGICNHINLFTNDIEKAFDIDALIEACNFDGEPPSEEINVDLGEFPKQNVTLLIEKILETLSVQTLANKKKLESTLLLAQTIFFNYIFVQTLKIDIDKIEKLIKSLLKYNIKEFWESDWIFHNEILKIIMDILCRIEPTIPKTNTKKEYYADAHGRFCDLALSFIEIVSEDRLSPSCLGDIYMYKSRIELYKRNYKSSFQKLYKASMTGNNEACFELAMLYWGFHPGFDNFRDLEQGFQLINIIKTLPPWDQDDSLSTKQDEWMLSASAEEYTDEDKVNIVRKLVYSCLARHLGYECQQNSEQAKRLLGKLEELSQICAQRLKGLMTIVDAQPGSKNVASLNANQAYWKWLKGKRIELRDDTPKKSQALELYSQADKLCHGIAGMALVNVAIDLHDYSRALSEAQKLERYYKDIGRYNDIGALDELIEQLTLDVAKQKAIAESVAISLLKSEEPKKKGKKKHSKIKSEAVESPPLHATVTLKDKTTSTSGKDTPQRLESPPEIVVKPPPKIIYLKPLQVTEKEQKAFYSKIKKINQLHRNAQYEEAEKQLESMTAAPTEIHEARYQQLRAWVKYRQAADPLYIRRATGKNPEHQHNKRDELRSEAEQIALNAFANLLRLVQEEIINLPGNIEIIMQRRSLSPEYKWPVSSLLSTLGHIYDDIFHMNPRLQHLRGLSQSCYEQADTINPVRKRIKLGVALTNEDLLGSYY